jgi:hypothetical protein
LERRLVAFGEDGFSENAVLGLGKGHNFRGRGLHAIQNARKGFGHG